MEKTRYTLEIEYSSMEDKRDFEKLLDKELNLYKQVLIRWNDKNNLTISKS